MVNYFLDTNVLVGYSFLQNRWRDHSSRLLSTGNSLHIGEIVLYEYCVKKSPGAPSSDIDIGWDATDGVFGTVQRNLRKGKRYVELELRKYDDEELSPCVVADIVIDRFEVEDEVSDRIHKYFRHTLDDECEKGDARDALNTLVHTITSTAKERKLELARRVNFHRRSKPHVSIEGRLRRLIYDEAESYGPDAGVLTDAYDLKSRNIVERVVTGDKGDIYLNSKPIDTITGLSVLYLKDEFATQTI